MPSKSPLATAARPYRSRSPQRPWPAPATVGRSAGSPTCRGPSIPARALLYVVLTPGAGTGGATLLGTLTLGSDDPLRTSVVVNLNGNAVTPTQVQNLTVLDARVKDGTVYDRITAASCAAVGGEVTFGDTSLAGDQFVVTLTDQTGQSVASGLLPAPTGAGTALFSGLGACNLTDGIIAVTVTISRGGGTLGAMTGTSAVKSTSTLPQLVLNLVPTLFSTIQVCGTAPAGAVVFIYGGSGDVSVQLGPGVTSFCLDVPLRSNTENNLAALAMTATGFLINTPEIKITQVNPSSVLIAEASSRPLTEDEITTLVDNGVISLNDPSNFNVSMFTIVLTIGQFPVTISQPVVVDPTPGVVSYGSGGGGGGGSSGSSGSGSSTNIFVVQVPPSPGVPSGQTIPGVIIIDGRIRTLKEFFQVTIAIQNVTTDFNLTNMSASIVLSSGLTPVKAGLGTDVAAINTGSSLDTVAIGAIGPHETGTGQFIIRGDGIGTHNVFVDFQGFLNVGGLAEPFPISGSAGATVQVFGPPKLDVVVRHPGDPNSPAPDVNLGEIYTLTVEVTNRSPVPALYASLNLLIGQGAILVDQNGDPVPGSSTTRNLGNIQPGQTVIQAFRLKSLIQGKIIACQAVASENLTLSVDIGGGSCSIANTIPANFEFPPANAPPTIMAINPLNNRPNLPVTTSVMAILTPQTACLTPDSWTNIVTDWIDPSDHAKGLQVLSADLVSAGAFYLEEIDTLNNPVRHIPTDLTVTTGVDGSTSIAVLRLGLASPLSQFFLKPNAVYRATLVGGVDGLCNKNVQSVKLATTFQWTFSTAQTCTGITAPTVTLSQPPDGSTDQPLNRKMVLAFSNRMETTTFTFDPVTPLNSSFVVLAGGAVSGGDVVGGSVVPGAAAFSNLFQTFTYTPSGNLPIAETIRVRLKNSLKDTCGQSLQTPANGIRLFSFATIPPDNTPPAVPIVNPVPALTNQQVLQVSGAAEPASVVYVTGGAAPATATTAMAPLTQNSVNNLRVSAKDASDNVSPATTVDLNSAPLSVLQDSVAPTVLSVTPAAGATGVARTSVVTVVMSESITSGTVNSMNFTLDCGSGALAGSFTLNGSTGFTFTPANPIDYNKTCTIRLRTGGISDLAGNTLASQFVSSFAAEIFAAPTLTLLTPASGVQGTTFSVTLTGASLATASAMVSDNPGVSGSITTKSDTSVVASITITPLALPGATTLGLTTFGGTVKLPFTVTKKPPVITAITPNQGAQGTTVIAAISGSGFSSITNLAMSGSGVSISDLGGGNDGLINARFIIDVAAATGARTVDVTTSGGSTAGTFTVTLSHKGPTANAGANKSTNQGVQVCFDGSGSIPGDSPITTYSWSFGDGAGATGISPCHTYNTVGSYPVTLTVTDSFGVSDSATSTVTVNNVAPTVHAGANQVVAVGSSVTFSGSYSDPGSGTETFTTSWNFGDGSPAVTGTLVPSHTYTVSGTYTVTLTVTDNLGGIGTGTLTVTAMNFGPAQFQYSSGTSVVTGGVGTRMGYYVYLPGNPGAPVNVTLTSENPAVALLAPYNTTNPGAASITVTIPTSTNSVYLDLIGVAPLDAPQFRAPCDVARDSSGNLYIADYSNNRVRKVDAATGIITTVAGSGTAGFFGDGGAATSAQLNGPNGVSVDSAGNLYIADYLNHRFRKVDAITGVISTFAGTGTAAYNGDGVAATSAHLNGPVGGGV